MQGSAVKNNYRVGNFSLKSSFGGQSWNIKKKAIIIRHFSEMPNVKISLKICQQKTLANN